MNWKTIGNFFETKVIDLNKENNYSYDLSDFLKNDNDYVEAFFSVQNYTADNNPIKTIDMSFELKNKVLKMIGNVEKYNIRELNDIFFQSSFFEIQSFPGESGAGTQLFRRINNYTCEVLGTRVNQIDDFFYTYSARVLDSKWIDNSFKSEYLKHRYKIDIYIGNHLWLSYRSKSSEYFANLYSRGIVKAEWGNSLRMVIEDMDKKTFVIQGFASLYWGGSFFWGLGGAYVSTKNLIKETYEYNNMDFKAFLIKRTKKKVD